MPIKCLHCKNPIPKGHWKYCSNKCVKEDYKSYSTNMEYEKRMEKKLKGYYVLIVNGRVMRNLCTKKQIDNIKSYSKDKIEVIKL